jgi:ketosteroid isomerase-like protein
MDLVLGITLRDYMRELGAIPLSECREIAMQVASGIAAAHKEGIVHRDLKPSNIILSRDKNSDVWAKVVDFGIAKINEHTLTTLNTLTAIGTLMGTPRYMSPEQCSGKEVDSRSDIYSLGIIIYEMFAGRPPFDAPSPMALALKHIQEQPVSLGELRPGLPREIVALVMQMLDKDPDRRPGSAMEIYHKFSDLSLKETQHQVLSSSQKSGLTHTWIQKHLAYMIPVLLLLFSAGLLAGLYLFRGSSGTGTQDEREPAAVVYREEERPAINEKKEQENRAGERDAGPVKEPDKVREREGRGDLESPRRELRNQLTRWVAATNSGNVKGQMSFYMPRVHAFYRARNVPRSSVRAEKARLTANASSINISTSEPQITISEDGRSAIMLFRKSYQIESSSESRQGEVLQELRWIKTDSGWKITSERDLRVL